MQGLQRFATIRVGVTAMLDDALPHRQQNRSNAAFEADAQGRDAVAGARKQIALLHVKLTRIRALIGRERRGHPGQGWPEQLKRLREDVRKANASFEAVESELAPAIQQSAPVRATAKALHQLQTMITEVSEG